MSAKKKYRTPNEYLKYLKGELSPEERYSFERDLEADPFEMEAMEGMENIPAAELEEDLLSVHAGMHRRLKRRKRRTFYYAAASVTSLLIVGTIFLNIYNINPKSAEEAIPRDESFLHEKSEVQSDAIMPIEEAETPVSDQALIQEQADISEEERIDEDAMVLDEVRAAEDVRVVEDARAIEQARETPDPEEIIPQEGKALGAMEMVSDEAEAPLQEAEDYDQEAEAPAPVSKADELVVYEAQPKRSQKKDRARKARAQQAPLSYSTKTVSGVVVSSEDMEPLPGASLMVKGSDSGMVADMEGRFTLVTDRQDQTTVIASYIGMETEEHQLAEGDENRVVMQPDETTLNEVVVIGSEADKSVYATGAVQTVELDKEENKFSGAEPEGGLEAYKMYIEEQIRFPAGDTISKREVVVLKFNVESDGSISRIRTLRSPGSSFTEEALRLLNEGPSWNPAINESGATDDVVRMRIVFKK